MNDFESSLCSLSYASVDEAASFVTGEGTLLAKLDIKSAYRNVPVHPEDRLLLDLRWQGHVDTCLPFGLCSAPKIFNATADALEWMIAQRSSGVVQLYYITWMIFSLGGTPILTHAGKHYTRHCPSAKKLVFLSWLRKWWLRPL